MEKRAREPAFEGPALTHHNPGGAAFLPELYVVGGAVRCKVPDGVCHSTSFTAPPAGFRPTAIWRRAERGRDATAARARASLGGSFSSWSRDSKATTISFRVTFTTISVAPEATAAGTNLST